MKDWYEGGLLWRYWSIFHHSVVVVPFLLVLCMPKKVGVRCCLFFFMILCFALRFLEYWVMVWGNFYESKYLIESGNYMANLNSTNAEVYETEQKTGGALVILGGQAFMYAWFLCGFFLLWCGVNCCVMGVYWKFYATAKNIW